MKKINELENLRIILKLYLRSVVGEKINVHHKTKSKYNKKDLKRDIQILNEMFEERILKSFKKKRKK